MHTRRLIAGLVLLLILQPKNGATAEPLRTDRHGDPLPPGALARLGTVRLRHGDWIRSIVFSADGKTIASLGVQDETIRLWDVGSGREVAHLTSKCKPLSISVQGRSLTLAYKGGLQQWDFHAKRTRMLWQHDQSINCTAISADGKLLATADYQGTIVLRDAATGKELRCLSRRKDEVWTLLFAYNGKVLVSNSASHDGSARVWDVATGRELRCLQQDARPLALSPDGTILVSASEDQLNWWDLATGKKIRSLAVQTSCAAFTSDGRFLASSVGPLGGQSCCLWRVSDGKEIRRWTASEGFRTLAFSPDDKLLAIGGTGRTVRVFQTASGKELRAQYGHVAPVKEVSINADGRNVLTLGEDDNLLLWETPSGRLLRRFPLPSGPIRSIAASADGRTVAVVHRYGKSRLHLWDAATGAEIRPVPAQGIPVTRATLSADGKYLFTAANSDTISVWDIRSGKKVRTLGRKNGTDKQMGVPINKMTCSPDDRWLTPGRDYGETEVILWDLAAGRKHRLHQQPTMLSSPAFSADGKVLLAMEEFWEPRSHYNVVRLWEVESGMPRSLKLEKVGDVSAFALAPGGEILATAEEKRIRLWDIASGAELRHFDGHRSSITALAFSADGRILVSGSADTTALVWDIGTLVTNRERRRIDLSRPRIEALWRDLAGDAAPAGKSLWQLIAGRQTTAFLAEHLHPVAAPDVRRIARLIDELDSGEFAVREQATRELEKLGELAAPQLRKTLANRPSLEMRRRIDDILAHQHGIELRLLRAIEILEHIGSDDARQLLRKLAEGTPEARLTQEARAALKRLERLRR